jgi:hypothetical protein
MRKKRRRKIRAVTTILVLMTIALAVIFVAVREPGWYRDLLPERVAPNLAIDDAGNIQTGESISTDWVLPAIAGIVVIGGVSIFVVLNKSSH